MGYEETLKEVKELYPPEEDDDGDDMDSDEGLGASVPQSIRDMVGCKGAIEALGGMIW